MTTEKALREALDTLVAVVGLTAFKYEGQRKPLQEAIDNARAALSLPETQGEPVAWMYVWPKNNLPYLTRHIYDERLSVEARAARAAVGVKEFPLYAAPPSQPAQGEPFVCDSRVCHAPSNRCYGCPHYHGKASVCSYAPPSQPAQGWRLVPVEPTPEMWDAAWNSIVLPYRAKLSMHEIKTLFDLFHKAMLAAAPAAPTQAKPTNGEGA